MTIKNKFKLIADIVGFICCSIGVLFRGFKIDWINLVLTFTVIISLYGIIRYLSNVK